MMTSPNLENLAKIGKLKKEAVSQAEFDGLIKSGRARLSDARTVKLSLESRFDLAYNASHALALAALRWHGYRSENRYLVSSACRKRLVCGRSSGGCWQFVMSDVTSRSTKAIWTWKKGLFRI
jgi:hypothetical protein